eukprot:1152961-Pelagomonas_calceolata.AAC.3
MSTASSQQNESHSFSAARLKMDQEMSQLEVSTIQAKQSWWHWGQGMHICQMWAGNEQFAQHAEQRSLLYAP